jgi:NAD(P)-dependent dehydrogenase (short-subunit alcohol dehydrogenase family)
MTPTPRKTPFVTEHIPPTSTFKENIFNGKVLFCTGGGSGICRGMVKAMASDEYSPRLVVLIHLIKQNNTCFASDETRGQCGNRGQKVRVSLLNLSREFHNLREKARPP